MASYVFKAMDLTGAKATGEVEADTKQVVADQLKARGLIVLDIKAKHGSKEISLDFLKRVKPTDLTGSGRIASKSATVVGGPYGWEIRCPPTRS